ncbi:hypothetical protein F5X98DRAFT_385929 [Xylaria grammica]|nr:hypothetical protein F5X98DRAFT_385929 [Xylaria grammica]
MDAVVKQFMEPCFRPENPTTADQARKGFDVFHSIYRRAVGCNKKRAIPEAWSHSVYWPLVEHVFSANIGNDAAEREPLLEPVIALAASIPANLLPVRRNPTGSTIVAAVSVVECTDDSLSLNTSEDTRGDTREDTIENQIAGFRAKGKFTNFVVTLNLSNGREQKLKAVFSQLAAYLDRECLPVHVNQTLCPSLLSNPIGLYIDINGDSEMVNNAIVVSAWYHRMAFLRSKWFELQGKSLPEPNPGDLISVPIIRVNRHNWEVYFVRFATTGITIYGPVPIGSTDSIVQVYVLVASLRAISAWLNTKFNSGLQNWFSYAADVDGYSTTDVVGQAGRAG